MTNTKKHIFEDIKTIQYVYEKWLPIASCIEKKAMINLLLRKITKLKEEVKNKDESLKKIVNGFYEHILDSREILEEDIKEKLHNEKEPICFISKDPLWALNDEIIPFKFWIHYLEKAEDESILLELKYGKENENNLWFFT